MPTPSPAPAPHWRDGLLLALLAAAIRLAHLLLSRADPSWGVPVIDAATYRDLGLQLADGRLPAGLVWQPILYPLLLAAGFVLGDGSLLVVRLLQVAGGALTCWLTWRLADLWYGRRIALTAGALIACCGPLIFFEAQLLAAGTAALLTVLLVLAADRTGRGGGPGPALGLGLAAGLAILLRPTFVPAVAGLLVWLAVAGGGPRRALLAGLALLAVLGPVEGASRRHYGHGAILPTSGAVNLHIGNNPEAARTIAIRPGLDWDRLMAEPQAAGLGAGAAAGQRYFRRQVLDYATGAPGDFLRGLGDKTLHLLSSRELPRNQDVYLHRRWSPVLGLLVLRLGPWGLPAGILLPLAAYGIVLASGRRQWPGLIVLGGGALALVAVFVAARYRAPLLPLLAIFAAAGLHRGGDLRRFGRQRRVTAAALLAAVVALIGVLPGPFPQERRDLTGELHFAVGHALYRQQETAGAEEHLRRALALDPGQVSARNFLAIILAERGEAAAAAALWAEALELAPDYGEARRNLERLAPQLAEARFREGRSREAGDPRGAMARYREAVRLAPAWAEPAARLAWLQATAAEDSLRDGAAAVRQARRALRLGGAHPYLQLVLAAALAEQGAWPAATAAADSGLALTGHPAHARWARSLAAVRERCERHEPTRTPRAP